MADLVYFVITILLSALLVYVLLMGESKYHRDGYIGKLHGIITYTAWVKLRYYMGPSLKIGNAQTPFSF